MSAKTLARAGLPALLLTALLPLAAAAQNGRNYDVGTMNFDLWCQEEQQLPPDRCDKRLPDDEKAFEAYRDTVERYEIPYLQRKNNELSLDRDILHNDPIDNPTRQDPQAQQQAPSAQVQQAPRVPPP